MNDKSNIRIPNPPDPPQDREIYDSTTVTIGCGFPIMILFFLISFFLFVSCSTTRTVNSASQETKMSLNTEDHSHATGSTETNIRRLPEDGNAGYLHEGCADPEGGEYKTLPEMADDKALQDQTDRQHEKGDDKNDQPDVKTDPGIFGSFHFRCRWTMDEHHG